MKSLNPYLTFPGNCEEAFNFYKSVFGGEFSDFNRFGEMPPQEGVTMPEELKNKIMHISFPIGSSVLMGSDTGGENGPPLTVGNNITLLVNVESKAQADKFFAELSEKGSVVYPMENTFWGSYFGICSDQFGINWMISFDENPT